jgi:hypothetical protein
MAPLPQQPENTTLTAANLQLLAALLQSKQAMQGTGNNLSIHQIAQLLPIIDTYTNPTPPQ